MDEIGTITVERICADGSGAIRITRADRRIRISRESAEYLARAIGNAFTLDGDVLTIRDDYGQRYIYRIRWDDYADDGYLAEWD